MAEDRTIVKYGSLKIPIYRTPISTRGQERFTATWYEAGERKRRTFRNLTEAKAGALDVAIKLANGQIAAVEMTAADHESYIMAMAELEPIGVSLHAAVREYVSAVRALPEGVTVTAAIQEYVRRHKTALPAVSVREAVDALIKSKRADGLHRGYVNQMEQALRRFADAFQVNIGAVRAKEVQHWIRATGGAPKSQNNLRTTLVILGNFARDMLKALPMDQPVEFSLVKKLAEREAEVEILTIENMRALLAAAKQAGKDEAILWFALGGFAGLRPKEALQMHWEDVDLKREYIRIRAGKTKVKTKRLVPVLPVLTAWIGDLAKASGAVFVRSADARAQYFARTLKMPIPFDGLRHSFGTFRVAQTGDKARTALEMGNSVAIIEAHYDRVVLRSEGEEWFSIVPA